MIFINGIVPEDKDRVTAKICQFIAIGCWIGIGSLLVVILMPSRVEYKRDNKNTETSTATTVTTRKRSRFA